MPGQHEFPPGPVRVPVLVLASWAFYKGVQGTDLAQGAAIALFLFPVLVVAAIVMLRLARRTETV